MSTAATERVGRYQLLDPIGVGPSGSVSRAKVFGVAGFERQFAIKRFHAELTTTGVLAQALSAAARAYGSLEHPRIARMSEFGVAQGTTFTAVEYVPGLDALRLIAEVKMAGATLAPGGALALVSQAARAVGYAHGRGLTHLGLAPTNVMITADGDIKITDFGILAAALPPRPTEVPRLLNRIPYLSPEQLASEATSAATDVFALGILAYELVTGHRTFRGETAQQIAQSVMAGPPIEPPLPRPIVRVLQRCLARSPFERFPDARALADALDAALRVAPVPGTRKDIGAQVKQTMERIAQLHEGEMSGFLALNVNTGPIQRIGAEAAGPPADRPPPPPVAVGHSDDFATNEFAKIEPGPELKPAPPRLPPEQPGSTVPDLRPGALSTVPGVPPIPIPVPQGVAPPPIPPPPPAIGTSTLIGMPSHKPPPIPGARSAPPPPPPPGAPPARPGSSGAPTGDRPGGLPRLPTPRPIVDAPTRPVPAAEVAAGARMGTDLAIPQEPPAPALDEEIEISIGDRDRGRMPTVQGAPDAALLDPLFDPIPGAPPEGGADGAAGARPRPEGPKPPGAPPPPPASQGAPAGGAQPQRTLIGFLPEEPVAFAGGTNVEMQVARDEPDDRPTAESLGPSGTRLERAQSPPVQHASAEPAATIAGEPAPAETFDGAHASLVESAPPQAPYGGGHMLPPPGAYPADPSAVPPGPGGYPAAAGLAMPRRDSDLAGPQSGAGVRSRRQLALVLGGVVAAVALAIGGWLIYGAVTRGDEPAGGGGQVAGGGESGSAPAAPGDAAIAVAAADAAPPPPPDAPKALAELSIVSTPPGARVFINGSDAGTTPLKMPGTPDRHNIALLLAGHELYVAQIDGHGTFSIPLREVTPSGGPAGIKVIKCKDKERYYVFVDGKPTGQTCPTERIETTLGPHTVEIYDVITESRKKWEIEVKETRLSHRVRIEP